MGSICEKIRIQRLTKVGHSADVTSDDVTPSLSSAQKSVIKSNWVVLKQHVANVGVITFVSLFEDSPDLTEVFYSFKGKDLTELHTSGLIRVHALRVMATIDKCIMRLEEPSNLANLLKGIGQNHNRYKVTSKHLEKILPHFLNAIKPHIDTDWSPEVEEAWTAMFGLMLFHMKQGMTGAQGSNSASD